MLTERQQEVKNDGEDPCNDSIVISGCGKKNTNKLNLQNHAEIVFHDRTTLLCFLNHCHLLFAVLDTAAFRELMVDKYSK